MLKLEQLSNRCEQKPQRVAERILLPLCSSVTSVVLFSLTKARFVLASLFWLVLICSAALANVQVTSTGGTSSATYPTMKEASGAVNAGVHTGDIQVRVQGNTVETAPAVFNASGSGAASYPSISIFPDGGAARSITGNIAGPLIDLNGADNVTIDGLNTGGNSLTLSNTSTSALASTISFGNDATSITVHNTTILGSGTGADRGTVYISVGSGTGNDFLTLTNNNIDDAGSTPRHAVFASGSSSFPNNNITISGNNISDFFSPTSDTAAISIGTGNTDVTISNNRIFQTAARTFLSAANTYAGVTTVGAGILTIINNTIGFGAADGTGTTTISGQDNQFRGIYLNVSTTGTSSVQGNTISGIVQTTSRNVMGTGPNAGFVAILVNDGQVNIGTVTGNNIGSLDGSSSITINATSTTVSTLANAGIWNRSNSPTTISGNNIGSITVATGGIGTQVGFVGIRTSSDSVTPATVSNNTIAGITVNPQSGQVIGIKNDGFRASSIIGNVIRNLTHTGANFGSGAGASVIGISNSVSFATGVVISQNTIHTLANTNVTGTPNITGISNFLGNSGTNIVERNFVHSFSISSTNNASVMTGIEAGAGTATYKNNWVRLGIDAAGGSVPRGYVIDAIRNGFGANSVTSSFVHNTAVVDGSAGSTSSNSNAFRSLVALTDSVLNNIIANIRTTSGGTGVNAAATYAGPLPMTGPQLDYNLYVAISNFVRSGATNYETLSEWAAASGRDQSSGATTILSNINFVDATGDASKVNLHLQDPTAAEGAGLFVGDVTHDFDGQSRLGLTPTDIGADAGNFLGIDIYGPTINYTPLTNGVDADTRLFNNVTITDSSGVNTSPGAAPRGYYKRLTDGNTFNDNTNATPGWKYVEADNTSSPFGFTIAYTKLSGGTGVAEGNVIQYFVIAQDLNGTPNVRANAAAFNTEPTGVNLAAANFPVTLTRQYTIVPTFEGTYNVGAGQTYTSLTNPGGIFEALNNGVVIGDVTINITSDLTGETGAVPLNQWVEDVVGGHSVTITASGGARTVEGSAPTGLFKLNGAARVMVDGDLGGGSLTFRNISTSGATVLFINDASNNVFTDLTIEGVNTSLFGGVVVFGNGTSTGNDNNDLTNVTIRALSNAPGVPANLLFSSGTSAAVSNSSNFVADSRFRNFTNSAFTSTTGNDTWTFNGIDIEQDGARSTPLTGIDLSSQGTNTFQGITIHDIRTTGPLVTGIRLRDVGNTTVTGIRIYNLEGGAGSTVIGIEYFGGPDPSTVTVANSQISNNPPGATDQTIIGVNVGGGPNNNLNLYNSSFLIGGTASGPNNTFAFLREVGTATLLFLRNNILANFRTGGGANHIAIADRSATSPINSDYNLFVGTGTTPANYFIRSTSGPGTPVPYHVWQGTPPDRDANSIAGNPGPVFSPTMFVDPATGDLHINPGSGFDPPPLVSNRGVPIPDVTTDVDGEPRSPTRTDIGADEFNVNRTLNSEGFLPPGLYDNITANSPAVVTLGGNVNVDNSFTVNSGASLSDGGTGVITGPGGFTLNASATMSINNALGITTSGATGVVQVTGTRTYSPLASFNFLGSANPHNTGDGFGGANNLIINKANQTDVVNFTNSDITVNSLQVQFGTAVTPNTFTVADVTVFPGATMGSAPGGRIFITGDLNNNGTIDHNDRVYFIGTSPQTVGGTGSNDFFNLEVNNPSGVTLTGNASIQGGGSGMAPKSITEGTSLELLNGTVTTGPNTLIIGPNATVNRTNGSIVGNLKKIFSGPSSFNFDVSTDTAFVYSPVSATILSGTGELTVNARNGSPPQITAANRLTKFWTVTNNSGSLNANLVFNHNDPGDIAGAGDANFRIHRIQGASVVNFPNNCPPGASQACVDTTSNTGTINNVSIIGSTDWTLADPQGPTAIELIAFAATGYDEGVFLEWKTGRELDNLGFNLYRDEAGKRVLVNNQLIAGSALIAGSRVAVQAGEAYVWWDNTQTKTAAYWLEDVDLRGASAWHGPFFARQVGGAPPARSQAARLGQLALNQTAENSSRSVETVASVTPASSEQTGKQTQLASGPAVKITVKREGFYKIPQPELVRAGLPAKVDPRFLQLFVEGREIPIIVSTGAGGSFDENAAITFYGLGLDTPSTDTRTYWLVAGEKEGKRIGSAEEKGVPSSSESFTHAVERRDRSIYFPALRNGERENFFGAVVASSPVDQTLSLTNLHHSASSQAVLEVALQGVTGQAHRVHVALNDVPLGEVIFDSQEQGIAKFALQDSMLREGANTVRLQSVNGPSDISLVDYLRVNYQHSFTADNDALKLRVEGNERITLNGFSSEAISVFDVTDEDEVTELKGEINQANNGYSFTFAAAERGERTLLAFTDERVNKPATIKPNLPSNLRSPNNAADFVILTVRDFIPGIEPLRIVRQDQGHKVAVIDIEDIYDEFSFGNKSAQSIKDLVALAGSSWKIKPRFVLLAGDASFDSRDYLGFGMGDIVPTGLVDTAFMETASDDWFADFNGDGIADLAVGRLPARSVEELAAIVRKLVGYDSSRTIQSALLVSDANDSFNFEQASEQLRAIIESRLRVEQLQRGRIDPGVAKARLMDALTRGQMFVNYSGHGSVNQWRGNLLTSEEARSLSNETLPVMVMMTCLNGYFHDAVLDSLAESLVKAEHGGAVAAWASSGLTFPHEQAVMNQQLYRALFGTQGKGLSLGEAALKTKHSIGDLDIRRTWILLGDPTMRLR